MEHHSNIVPWHYLRERKGAVLKWVDVDDDGNFSLDAFEQALTPRTKIVRDHAYVECAGHCRSGERSLRHPLMRAAFPSWSMVRKARPICPWMCAISTAIFIL